MVRLLRSVGQAQDRGIRRIRIRRYGRIGSGADRARDPPGRSATRVRAVVQRVSGASVDVSGRRVSSIGAGLLVLVAVAPDDGEAEAKWLAEKLVGLRIFSDQDGKMN